MQKTVSDPVTTTRNAIDKILNGPAGELVGAYYSSSPRTYGARRNVLFAGHYFDELGENPPNEFTPADLAAASLLDVRFGPHTVRRLIDNPEAGALLAAVPPGQCLWDVPRECLEQRDSAIWKLWGLVRDISGLGQTRASKLLARKRPLLMPILDSVVVQHLHLQRTNQWILLRKALTPDLRERIDALGTHAVSTLR